jgi:hypothetical protein
LKPQKPLANTPTEALEFIDKYTAEATSSIAKLVAEYLRKLRAEYVGNSDGNLENGLSAI